MKVEVFANAESVARQAAALIAGEARAAISARGRFIMAGSGGHTLWLMLRAGRRRDGKPTPVGKTTVNRYLATLG